MPRPPLPPLGTLKAAPTELKQRVAEISTRLRLGATPTSTSSPSPLFTRHTTPTTQTPLTSEYSTPTTTTITHNTPTVPSVPKSSYDSIEFGCGDRDDLFGGPSF